MNLGYGQKYLSLVYSGLYEIVGGCCGSTRSLSYFFVVHDACTTEIKERLCD